MVAIGRLCSEAWNRQGNDFERNVQMKNSLIAVLLAACAALCARGDTWTDPETGIEWTYFVSNGEASLGSGTSSGTAVDKSTTGEIVIPSSLGGCPVTSIGAYAFYNCSGLTSVTIPDGVTSIGKHAFYNCTSLTSVTIPDCVTSIETGYDPAFENCVSLTSVTIPQYVLDCQIRNVFPWSCSSITNISYSSAITNIGDEAFFGCSGLTGVTIPDSVTSIGFSAFSGCTNLTSVTIPDSVTSIGVAAFIGCSGLMSVTIPDSVTSIGDEAFSCCSGLMSVTIPDSVTSIGDEAFSYCSGLTSVTIPDNVTSIGTRAFYGCSGLTNVTIPDSVTSFGADCFERCPVYMRKLYQTILGAGGGGSVPASTTIVQQVSAPYALTNSVADRAIASVTVDSDSAIDNFVLKDGKVYDTMLYVSNTSDHEVTLSLPSGFSYKTIKGARPLAIPASSQCIISITRVAAGVFLVMREELSDVQ